MARRIKAADVRQLLIDEGHDLSEWDGADWEPGFRVEQAGPRQVHVFYDGPGEEHQLVVVTTDLRTAGNHVHAAQQERGGRRRLEVTRP